MRTAHLLALLALSVPALAACGASGGSQSSNPARQVAAHSTLPRPTALVLRAQDIGPGYLVDPNDTRRNTLAIELQHESAKARAADRRSFAGGYTATYIQPGIGGVISDAIVYRDEAAARIVSTDRIGIAHATHGLKAHPIKAPRSAPGTPRFTFAGTTHGMPMYGYGWQQGNVLEFIVIFGRHATVAQLMRLARTQDLRLTHPTFGT
jgi:hypothetical protein